MDPLTCPSCGARLDLLTLPVEHPAHRSGGNYVLPHTRTERAVTCTRCEFAETVTTLLSRSTPKRRI